MQIFFSVFGPHATRSGSYCWMSNCIWVICRFEQGSHHTLEDEPCFQILQITVLLVWQFKLSKLVSIGNYPLVLSLTTPPTYTASYTNNTIVLTVLTALGTDRYFITTKSGIGPTYFMFKLRFTAVTCFSRSSGL